MNKEFKTILILGIVSIFISGLGLYQFRNIKFKNTKHLQAANLEQQEKLTEKYDNIVDTYIPTITDKLPENDLPTTGSITLLIPGFLENEGFYDLADKLLENDIKVSIEQIDSYYQYETKIKNDLQNYDIALIPTNRLNDLNTQDITIGENIKPYFNKIFSDVMNSDTNKFIPFAIDPAITLYQNISPQNSRKDLFSYSLLRKVSKKYAMPIIRGFDTMSIKLFENGNTPFENFTELFVLQIKQIKSFGDNQELSYMIDTSNITSKNNYTYTNLKKIVELLGNQNKYCETFPATCVMRYGYSDIKFGFLSDFEILEKYFPGNNTLYAGNFTNSNESYPVKGWIFVIPNGGNKNTNLTNKFFSEYISESINGNNKFRNHTLSAITNIYDNQKTNPFFENIISNENNFYLFNGSINTQGKLVNDGKTIKMLEGKYSTNSYLSNFKY